MSLKRERKANVDNGNLILGDGQKFEQIAIEVEAKSGLSKNISSKQRRISHDRFKIQDCPSR